MYISPLERMKKIHLWIGTTSKSDEEWMAYFNQEDAISQFSIDIGIDEYDEDFIGILPLFAEKTDIKSLLDETPVSAEHMADAIKKIESLNIKAANAVFYLTDSSITPVEPVKDFYNDCQYIGVYDSSF